MSPVWIMNDGRVLSAPIRAIALSSVPTTSGLASLSKPIWLSLTCTKLRPDAVRRRPRPSRSRTSAHAAGQAPSAPGHAFRQLTTLDLTTHGRLSELTVAVVLTGAAGPLFAPCANKIVSDGGLGRLDGCGGAGLPEDDKRETVLRAWTRPTRTSPAGWRATAMRPLRRCVHDAAVRALRLPDLPWPERSRLVPAHRAQHGPDLAVGPAPRTNVVPLAAAGAKLPDGESIELAADSDDPETALAGPRNAAGSMPCSQPCPTSSANAWCSARSRRCPTRRLRFSHASPIGTVMSRLSPSPPPAGRAPAPRGGPPARDPDRRLCRRRARRRRGRDLGPSGDLRPLRLRARRPGRAPADPPRGHPPRRATGPAAARAGRHRQRAARRVAGPAMSASGDAAVPLVGPGGGTADRNRPGQPRGALAGACGPGSGHGRAGAVGTICGRCGRTTCSTWSRPTGTRSSPGSTAR